MEIHHPGCTPNFSFKLDRSWKTSLQRQVWEAIKIEESPLNELMNSRSEWGSNSIPRVTIHQHKDRDDHDPATAGDSARTADEQDEQQQLNERPGKRVRATGVAQTAKKQKL